jgi:hypothetical protein
MEKNTGGKGNIFIKIFNFLYKFVGKLQISRLNRKITPVEAFEIEYKKNIEKMYSDDFRSELFDESLNKISEVMKITLTPSSQKSSVNNTPTTPPPKVRNSEGDSVMGYNFD